MVRHLAHALDLALLGAVALFIALGLVLSVSGCSTFLPAADRVSLITNRAIATAQREAHDARAAQLDACTDEACLDAGEAAWAPWLAVLESVRELGSSLVDVLGSAGRLGDSPEIEQIVIEAACDIVHAWDRLPAGAAALRAAGVHLELPALPPQLDALVHAGAALLCAEPASPAQ